MARPIPWSLNALCWAYQWAQDCKNVPGAWGVVQRELLNEVEAVVVALEGNSVLYSLMCAYESDLPRWGSSMHWGDVQGRLGYISKQEAVSHG